MLCDRKIPVKLKGKVYKTVIRPAMLHAAETWATKETEEKRLEVQEMRMLRWMNKITRRDKVENRYVRGSMKVANIKDRITESRQTRKVGRSCMEKRSDRTKQTDAGDESIRKKKRKTEDQVEGWCDTGHEEHWGAKRGGNGQSGMEESGASSLWRPEGMSRKRKKKKKTHVYTM